MTKRNKTYTVYMLRCSDDTLYTGITTELKRRVEEHNHSDKGAKYTRTRRPVLPVYAQECESRSEAQRLEYRIKKMTRGEKEELLSSGKNRV